MLNKILTTRVASALLWIIAIAAMAASMQSAALAETPAKPNFVIIFSDDHEFRQYGFLDSSHYTPSLDQLRSEGALLTNFYVPSTVCQPSRYSLFTGRYPSRSASYSFKYGERYTAFNTRIQDSFPSIAHGLKDAGYQTGYIGKIDGYTASDFNGDKFTGDPTNDQRILVRRMDSHGYTFAASLYKGNIGGNTYHNMEWVTQGALKFMDQAVAAQEPFFLAVCPTLLHDSSLPSLQRTVDGYADTSGGGTLTGAELTATQNAHLRGGGTGTDYTRQGVLDRAAAAGSAAPLLWLDDAVGAMLQKIKDLGIADTTYFIYVSDHGDGNGAKGDLYQNGINMPFIIRYPNGQANSTIDATVSLVDIVPTVYDLAGVDLPNVDIDGVSFAPILEDSSSSVRDFAYSEIGFVRTVVKYPYKYMAFRLPEAAMNQAIALNIDPHSDLPHASGKTNPFTGHFGKAPFAPWVSWYDKNHNRYDGYFRKDQLYNIETDYDEQDNLADESAHQGKLSEMKAIMADIIYDLPGSFHEFKFEAEINGTSVNSLLDVQGDLDLSYPFNVIAVSDGSNLTENEYTVITYTGNLTGEFSQKKNIQRKGYEVDYSTPGEVKLVRFDYSGWKTKHDISQNTPVTNDDDNDGIDLMIEYAMDLSPDAISPKDYVLYEMDEITGEMPEMQLIYKKLRPDLTYTVQWSTTMAPGAWSNSGVTEVDLRRDLVKATVPTGGAEKVFMRLLIEE